MTSPATGETGPGQASAQIAYQYPGGRVASSALYDESGVKVRSVSPVYGKEGELLTVTGSVLPLTAVYDALYRTVSLTDGRQNATHYTYSPGGYLASVTYPSGDLEQATGWDYDGNVLSASDGRGAVHTYQYNDPESHLTNVACVGAPSAAPQYTYDTYGRLTQAADANGWRTFTYDDNDSLATLTNHFLGMPLAQTVLPSYYPDGSLQTLSSPAGALTYTYNARGELTGLTNPAHDVFAWSYLDNGWLASEQSGNAALTAFAYNAAGQLLEQHTTRVSTGAVLSDFAMAGAGGYDGAGDLLGQSATLPLSPGAYSGTSNYGYDGLGQLTQEVSSRQGNSTHTFAYDAAGNPTTFRSLVGLSYNSDNQAGNNYDRDGSPSTWQAQTLTFDDNDTLTAIGAQSQYGYSDGARVWKQTATGKTYFLNVGGTPLCELDANGKVLASNTVGADGLCARTTASGSTFYSFDLQGGTALRLDAVGNVLGSYSHDAYGNRTSTDNSADPYSGYGAKWGYYRDAETGLSLLGARYYDASQGRFLNRDPIGYDGGINLYGYADNNPISNIDPSGLEPPTGPTPSAWISDGLGNAVDGLWTCSLASKGKSGAPHKGGKSGFGIGPLTAVGGGIGVGAAAGLAAFGWGPPSVVAAELAAVSHYPLYKLSDIPGITPEMEQVIGDAMQAIEGHKRPKYARGGWKWGKGANYSPFYTLPDIPSGYYQEYYLPDPTATGTGTQLSGYRITTTPYGNAGFYSPNHYTDFYRIW